MRCSWIASRVLKLVQRKANPWQVGGIGLAVSVEKVTERSGVGECPLADVVLCAPGLRLGIRPLGDPGCSERRGRQRLKGSEIAEQVDDGRGGPKVSQRCRTQLERISVGLEPELDATMESLDFVQLARDESGRGPGGLLDELLKARRDPRLRCLDLLLARRAVGWRAGS